MTVEGADTSVEGTELFDSLVDQAIAKVAPTLEETPEWRTEEVQETEDEAVEEVQEEEQPEKPADDSALARILAREEQVAAKERELEAKARELKANQGKAFDLDGFKRKAETNLSGALQELGLDQEYVMDVLIAEKLGDKAPQALKEKLRDHGLKKEIAKLREEKDQERRVAEAQAYYRRVTDEAREYVTKGLDSKAAPVVSQVSKEDPDFVHQLVIAELDRDAREKVARGEHDGQLLTYAEAAANIEKMFSKVAAVVKKAVTAETTSKKAVKKVVPPVTRPTEKPTDEYERLLDEGWKKAMQTYEREESKRRR